MNPRISYLAQKRFKFFKNRYSGFINVILDNWRGFRFVYDTKDVRRCTNNCQKCPLYLLFMNEKGRLFSAGLYPATEKDKKLFGPQNFLNCKTLKQYESCYENFLIKETKTKKEIEEELKLIFDLKIIFSKEKDKTILEREFKSKIIKKVLASADLRKGKIIRSLIIGKKL